MRRLIRPCFAGARYCASGLLTMAVWTAWLLLCLLLALQIYIASVRELQVPRFLLRAIEEHLAESGISVKFGRAIFDPSGRVLIERARFRLASFSEPVVTADAIYIRLDPWALFERRFEAREIRATGANLFVPAMLSSSGKAEKIIQDLDAGFSITSRGDEFLVDYLNCRLGAVSVSAHGIVNAGTVARDRGMVAKASLPLAEFIAINYVALSREFSKAEEQMAGLDHAVLTAVLTPSDTRGAVVYAELGAERLELSGPVAVEATGIRAATRFPLLGGAPLMTSAYCSAETVRVGEKTEIRGVRFHTRGILRVDTLSFSPKELEATAGQVLAANAVATAPVVRVEPRGEKAYSAEAAAWLLDDPVAVSGEVDLGAKSADVAFDGRISPGVEDILAGHLKVNLRKFVDIVAPVAVSGRARLSSGWHFDDVNGHVDARGFTVYHVPIGETRGDVDYSNNRLLATHAIVAFNDNRDEGSYEQNFKTNDYRFLLDGRLRPMEIGPWFLSDWWAGIFKNFDFTSEPVQASVDVRGRYGRERIFSVFVAAHAKNPAFFGVPLDGMRTLLNVEPEGCSGLEFWMARGSGDAQGSFRLSTEAATGKWSGFDVDVTSSLDPSIFSSLLPPEPAAALAAFSFAKPPSVYALGHFDGPATEGSRHQALHLEVRTPSELHLHGVGFEKASFKVDVKDSQIDVSDVEASFAGGTLGGNAQVTGSGPDRKVRFKVSLNGASLGQAAAAGAGYVVTRKQGGTTALETFARDKSGVILDLNLTGDGRPGELASFKGEGNFQVQGAQLGEVALLGGLSKFLKFPELRFTQARAEFKLEDALIIMPDLGVLGANSAIKAKGMYAIEQHQLDFTATVYPFQESHSLLQVFNALSSPISAVLRVRLTGSLDKPSWSLAYSPLNLLRESDIKPVVPAKPPAAPAPTPAGP